MPNTTRRPAPVEYTIAGFGNHTTAAVILDGIHIVTSGQPQYTEVTTLLTEADTTDPVIRGRLLGLITGAITPGEAPAETTEQESTVDDAQVESAQRGYNSVATTIRLSDRFTIEAGQLVADGDADGQGSPVGGSLPDLIMALAASDQEPVRLAALLALAERFLDTGIIDTAPEVTEHLWDWVTDHAAGITTNGRILGYMATVPGPVTGSYGVAVASHRGRVAGRVVGSDQLDELGSGPIATVIVNPADILEVPRGVAGDVGLVVTRVQIVTITPEHATGGLALDPARPLNRLGVQTLNLAELTSTPHGGAGSGAEDADIPDEGEPDEDEAGDCGCRCCD